MTKKQMKEALETKIYANEFVYRVKDLEGDEKSANMFYKYADIAGEIAESLKLLTYDEVSEIKSRAWTHAAQHIKNIKFIEEHQELLEA